MTTRSLKFRLVVSYAGFLVAVFAAFGTFVYVALSEYLEGHLRELVTRRTQQVIETIREYPNDWNVIRHEISARFAPEANNRFIRVTVNGEPLYQSGMPEDGSFNPKNVFFSGGNKATLARLALPNGTALFLHTFPFVLNHQPASIEFGASLVPVQSTLRRWLFVLCLGSALWIVVAIAGGYLLVTRALRPVDEIIRTAERITSQNLSERLPVPRTRDELYRLTTALNGMIRRLDASFQNTNRFLADASHELRTPLTIIRGEVETMRTQTRDRPLRKTAQSALEELDRMKQLVEGLFALSRLDTGEERIVLAAFDLGELIATTTEQMCLLAQDKRISVTCHTPDKVIVQGDHARLKQVAVNLLDNAIKYTPAGGAIDVRVSTQGGKAVLEVIDNGIGIPADAIPHIFERFYRVDKARSRELGGAGLGLSIVHSICAAHGGSVSAICNGGGTRLVVELPLA